ncbi:hypothetical protein DEO72_LG5g1602 [Vigna unguiculata]|uniref:Uncharacterized protein n=1 Tax=Vigna unguiculata TaxID=3917 RepID=A0A4D6LXV2_VIGUN|nr:hypothetical protein DEO72_LG5g1602 [Vigna unguiculata]
MVTICSDDASGDVGDGVLGSSTAKAHVACFGSFVVPNGTKYSCFLVRLQSGAISTAKWLTDMNGEVLVLHHRDVMNANKGGTRCGRCIVGVVLAFVVNAGEKFHGGCLGFLFVWKRIGG